MEAEAKTARKQLISDVLSEYPEKTAKKRARHINVYEEGKPDCGVKSNSKTIPGVMTARGCAYAGAKGVVWGPIKDMVHVCHGPVGCGQYSWGQAATMSTASTASTVVPCSSPLTSRKRTSSSAATRSWQSSSTRPMIFSRWPRGSRSISECPVGLIGDDINAVAKTSRPRKSTSRSSPCAARASAACPSHWATTSPTTPSATTSSKGAGKSSMSTPYDVALIGEYNIGGDAWAQPHPDGEMGLRVIGQWSGDGEMDEDRAPPNRSSST